MRCPACGSDNPIGAKFCNECAAPLASGCPRCSSSNPPSAKFCSQCAARLDGSQAAGDFVPTAVADDAPGHVAERRLVSVLFADLVGFTPFSEERDAEDVRETLTRYFDLARETIERYGGTVEKFIGDAVMAVWGTPTTHEDDAERAVRAALELVAVVPQLADGVQARAGVLTGEAAVTLGATHQGMVAGDLVNTAARLQSAAGASTVLVGEATRRAAEAAIAFEPAGEQALRGKASPIAAWRALRVVAAVRGRGRSERLEAPFVGRDDELRLMKELYHATRREGRPRLVSIIGPAGIGKSRLAWEFHKYLDGLAEQMWTHDGRTPAYGEGITFWALGEMIRERARLAESDDEETTRRGIGDMLRAHVPDEAERRWIEPAMLALLGVAESQAQPEELFAAWRTFFERMAETDPVVLVFEELHYADPGLLDFIDHLLDWSRTSPICVVTLARPELLDKRPDWGAGRRHFTSIYLEPLPRPIMRQLLDGLVPGLPDAAARQIVERADGVPLYAVETVRMLVADGRLAERNGAYAPTGDITDIAIPDSLTGLIGARLDALSAEQRSIIQDASVLGQSFTTAGLAAVSGRPEESLDELLQPLVRREILTLQADPRSPERGQYAFVQALIRDVAYNTLARRDRRTRHLAAARFFESLQTDELAGALARHYLAAYESAGEGPEADALAAQARVALRGAANRAISLGAPDQALLLFQDALRITTEDRERADLALRGGEAAGNAGRFEVADGLLRDAERIYQALGDRAGALRAIVVRGTYLLNADQPNEAKELLVAARDTYADLADQPIGIHLASQLARAHFFLNDNEHAIEIADHLLPGAERHDLVSVIADVLVTKGTALANVGRAREGRALLLGGRELGVSVGDHRSALRAYINSSAVLDLDDARLAFQLGRDGLILARRVGERVLGYVLLGNAAGMAITMGEWDWARAELDRALSEMDPGERYLVADALVKLATVRGDDRTALLDEFLPVLDAASDPQSQGNAIHIRGLHALGEGRFQEAAQLLADVAGTFSFGATEALTWRSHALVLAADLAGLRDNLERLRALGLHGRLVDATARRAEGAIAALEGRTAEALDLYRESIAVQAEADGPFGLALTGLEMASMFDAGIRQVQEAAEESRRVFAALGARPFLEWLDDATGRRRDSAGRPAHRATAEDVEMQVEDALP